MAVPSDVIPRRPTLFFIVVLALLFLLMSVSSQTRYVGETRTLFERAVMTIFSPVPKFVNWVGTAAQDIHHGYVDMRRAVNALQVAASVSATIDEDSLYSAASAARPELVKKLIETSLSGDFIKARDALDNLLIEYGLSGEDVVRQIHRTVFDLNVPDELKVRLIDRVGEAEFRLVEGSNERIQLEALLAHFVLVGQEIRKK